MTLRARFSDAQCGFKAVRADLLPTLLPEVEDESWFFDTELLVRAQRRGLRIHEVPVDWIDDPDSRVSIVRTALDDLRGVGRLMADTPVARFMGVGVLSTLAYALLFLLLRGLLGAAGANALALALAVLVAAGLAATVTRYVALRTWVFAHRRRMAFNVEGASRRPARAGRR